MGLGTRHDDDPSRTTGLPSRGRIGPAPAHRGDDGADRGGCDAERRGAFGRCQARGAASARLHGERGAGSPRLATASMAAAVGRGLGRLSRSRLPGRPRRGRDAARRVDRPTRAGGPGERVDIAARRCRQSRTGVGARGSRRGGDGDARGDGGDGAEERAEPGVGPGAGGRARRTGRRPDRGRRSRAPLPGVPAGAPRIRARCRGHSRSRLRARARPGPGGRLG